jgi:LmbE family N-acetylglucosaminyl deacetylase
VQAEAGTDDEALAETIRQRSERAGADEFGSLEALITHAVDVSDVLDVKRQAMEAHASQIAPDSFFLAMPQDAFAMAFGTEWFIALDGDRAPGDPFASQLLD